MTAIPFDSARPLSTGVPRRFGWAVVFLTQHRGACSTHSLRRSKVALVYKKTGNLRACQLQLGHAERSLLVRSELHRSAEPLPTPSPGCSR